MQAKDCVTRYCSVRDLGMLLVILLHAVTERPRGLGSGGGGLGRGCRGLGRGRGLGLGLLI